MGELSILASPTRQTPILVAAPTFSYRNRSNLIKLFSQYNGDGDYAGSLSEFFQS